MTHWILRSNWVKSIFLIAVSLPAQVFAYTPGVQATIFNAAMKNVSFVKSEQLINKTKLLHSSLNADEQISIYGHGSLKIASYMYLVDFWREYSVSRILSERGLKFTDEELASYSIDRRLFNLDLKYVGPSNYSIYSQCTVSTNKPFEYSYLDLMQSLQSISALVASKPYSDSAKAALFYIKAYYYQRLQLAVATYTYTNNDCQSDINGMLTCAADYVDISAIDGDRLKRLERYQTEEWNIYNVSELQRANLTGCSLTVWTYFQSGGGTEPLNDGSAVSASEALNFNVSSNVLDRAKSLSINSIMEENRDILSYLYDTDREPDIQQKAKLLSAVIITQMQIAANRTANYIEQEPL